MRGEGIDGLMENPQSFLIGDFMQKIRVLSLRYRLCLLVFLFYFLMFKVIQTEISGCNIDKRFCFCRHIEILPSLIKPDKCILCNVPGNSIFFRIFPGKTEYGFELELEKSFKSLATGQHPVKNVRLKIETDKTNKRFCKYTSLIVFLRFVRFFLFFNPVFGFSTHPFFKLNRYNYKE